MIRAASKTPSGKNGQPWRFRILNSDTNEKISSMLENSRWLSKCRHSIAVFLDTENNYDIQRDIIAIGASIENFTISLDKNYYLGFVDYEIEIESINEIDLPKKYWILF